MSAITRTSGFVLRFEPVVGTGKLDTTTWFKAGNYLVKVNNLRFYVSDINFENDSGVKIPLPSVYHLLDFERGFEIIDSSVYVKNLRRINFRLGIDSLTNVSGVMGGDLDPTNGMYWTWQSGYINLKIEGEWKEQGSSNDSNLIHLYEFHLGGYQFPYNSSQLISIKLNRDDEVVVFFSADDFFKKVNLSELSKVMSPSENAILLSRLAAESFHVKE